MNRIKPGDLHTLSPLLLEAGHALFGRSIKISLFGEEKVVAFFKQKEDYKSLLRKLERVHERMKDAGVNALSHGWEWSAISTPYTVCYQLPEAIFSFSGLKLVHHAKIRTNLAAS